MRKINNGRRFAGLAGGLCVLALGACQQPQKSSSPPPSIIGDGVPVRRVEAIDPTRIAPHDDIVEIHHFWSPVPWLYDADDCPIGFQVPVYFVSGETEKGAFVSGTIFVWLYRLKRAENGHLEREFVHNWEFNAQQAMGFRVRRLSVMGYHYGFWLTWPPVPDVLGRQIEIAFGYQRADGQVVTGAAKRFRVPVPRGFQRPAAPSSVPSQTVPRERPTAGEPGRTSTGGC
ncbi:MAG: hypothetical protein KKB50_13900 [Planctomycetes bacterium]|nr:hypothetical protein [Planctomycetota bacterium]